MEQEPHLRELILGLASDMNRQFAEMREHLGRHDVQFAEMREHLGRHDVQFAAMREHLGRHDVQFAAMRERLGKHDAQFAEMRERLGKHDAQFADLRLHFDITAEGLRHEIGILAESIGSMATKESVEALRAEMRTEFEGVRVEIRAAYASLDRRIGKAR